MVVGTGLLATIFEAYKTSNKVLIFASGVSNSKETDLLAFEREFKLLKETIAKYPTLKIVYFSTVSIADSSVNDSLYVQHKIALENYIKKTATMYLILRVSNVVGFKGNPNTIMNFLVSAVKHNTPVVIWANAERNIIDVEDVYDIVVSLLNRHVTNTTINVAVRESVSVKLILNAIENYYDKTAEVKYINKGEALPIATFEITSELKDIELKYGIGKEYIYRLLEKYYSK